MNNVARTGDVGLKWEQFKPLIKKKIEMVVTEFNETHPCINLNQPNVHPFDFEEVKQNILNGIDSFNGAPFTIQRICELLTNPYKHYKRTDKFMKGLEKNVLVVSEETVDQKTENGNSSFSNYLNSTFTVQPPSTSDTFGNNQASLLFNGFKDNSTENSYNQILNNYPNNVIQQPPPIQQLDSFTTVFVSQTQATALDEIVNIPIFDSATTINSTSTSSIQPTTNSCLLSSSVTITSVDPPLECNGQFDDNLSTENLIEQQSQTINEIQQTVNNEEEQQQTEIVENESIENNKVIIEQDDDKIVEETLNKPSISIEIVNEQDQQLNLNIEQTETVETIDNTPTKENNDLKRVYESPDDESIKRFKSDTIEDENCEKFEVELDDSKEEQTSQTDEQKNLVEEKENVITGELNNENVNQVDPLIEKNDVDINLNQQSDEEEKKSENKTIESEELTSNLENVKNLEPIESTESNDSNETE